MKVFIGFWGVLLWVNPISAHLASDSFINLRIDRAVLEGEWDLPVVNLIQVLPLDDDKDGTVSSAELANHSAEIAAYAKAHFQVTSNGLSCPLNIGAVHLDRRSAGTYAILLLKLDCVKSVERLDFEYSPFYQKDPQHKGYLSLSYQEQIQTAIFSKGENQHQIVLKQSSAVKHFFSFLVEGIWHIWLGFDHILFLLTLLLPSVLIRREGKWVAPEHFRAVLPEVIRVVTAFTVAHSITLALAALDLVSLPSRLVEATIAASVVLSALNNIFPVVRDRRWLIAFGFGFIHGFGFASVLGDLGLPRDALVAALLGFNLGVEAGQLAIVFCVLPLLFWLRKTNFYRRYFLIGGSSATAATAFLWMIERIAQLKFMPF